MFWFWQKKIKRWLDVIITRVFSWCRCDWYAQRSRFRWRALLIWSHFISGCALPLLPSSFRRPVIKHAAGNASLNKISSPGLTIFLVLMILYHDDIVLQFSGRWIRNQDNLALPRHRCAFDYTKFRFSHRLRTQATNCLQTVVLLYKCTSYCIRFLAKKHFASVLLSVCVCTYLSVTLRKPQLYYWCF